MTKRDELMYQWKDILKPIYNQDFFFKMNLDETKKCVQNNKRS
jgi:hypothetical protein